MKPNRNHMFGWGVTLLLVAVFIAWLVVSASKAMVPPTVAKATPEDEAKADPAEPTVQKVKIVQKEEPVPEPAAEEPPVEEPKPELEPAEPMEPLPAPEVTEAPEPEPVAPEPEVVETPKAEPRPVEPVEIADAAEPEAAPVAAEPAVEKSDPVVETLPEPEPQPEISPVETVDATTEPEPKTHYSAADLNPPLKPVVAEKKPVISEPVIKPEPVSEPEVAEIAEVEPEVPAVEPEEIVDEEPEAPVVEPEEIVAEEPEADPVPSSMALDQYSITSLKVASRDVEMTRYDLRANGDDLPAFMRKAKAVGLQVLLVPMQGAAIKTGQPTYKVQLASTGSLVASALPRQQDIRSFLMNGYSAKYVNLAQVGPGWSQHEHAIRQQIKGSDSYRLIAIFPTQVLGWLHLETRHLQLTQQPVIPIALASASHPFQFLN